MWKCSSAYAEEMAEAPEMADGQEMAGAPEIAAAQKMADAAETTGEYSDDLETAEAA